MKKPGAGRRTVYAFRCGLEPIARAWEEGDADAAGLAVAVIWRLRC